MDHRCLLDTPDEELPSSRFRKAKVYVDCNSFGPRAIEAAVSLYGAERIVCGTDGSEFGCDWTRKALAEAQIGEEAREQILHRNAAAMMARVVGGAEQGELRHDAADDAGSRCSVDVELFDSHREPRRIEFDFAGYEDLCGQLGRLACASGERCAAPQARRSGNAAPTAA